MQTQKNFVKQLYTQEKEKQEIRCIFLACFCENGFSLLLYFDPEEHSSTPTLTKTWEPMDVV